MLLIFDSIVAPVAILVGLLFFVVVIVVIIGLAKPRTTKDIGDEGEMQVATMLNSLQQKIGGYVINDIRINYYKLHSQIDHVFICKRGLFVIETKNYSGRIYGNERQKYWTQVLAYGDEKNKLYNPLMQNTGHLKAVNYALNSRINAISVVIFIQGNTEYINARNVFSLSEAKRFILSHNEYLDDQTISWIYRKLFYYKAKSLKSSPKK